MKTKMLLKPTHNEMGLRVEEVMGMDGVFIENYNRKSHVGCFVKRTKILNLISILIEKLKEYKEVKK